jgi:hypothetical protein
MKLTDAQIKHMVDRFLGWTLPKNFSPDAGVSYVPTQHHLAQGVGPSGTNLLDATQADAMVRHMADGMPE